MFYNCTHSGSRMLFLLIVSPWTDTQQKPISPLAEKISKNIPPNFLFTWGVHGHIFTGQEAGRIKLFNWHLKNTYETLSQSSKKNISIGSVHRLMGDIFD